MLTYPNIFVNDYAMQFFRDHGYPDSSYNDGMLAWLRDFYGVTGSTLPDLLARYRGEYGDDFVMRVLAKSAVPISLVEPAATFINATPSSAAGGNDTLLTSAGVHGLTSAVSVGSSIYISAGTGWTVGFHTITAIAVDTTGTTIQIDTPFDAGFGTPIIALANTFVTLATIAVPPLRADSQVRWDVTFTFTPDASAGSEDVNIRFDNQSIQGIALTGATRTMRYIGGFANKGTTSAQTNFFVSGSSAIIGSTTIMASQYTIDTSVSKDLTLLVAPSMANSVVSLNRYLVELFL